jgi:dTDP-4-amino-4,6-dideoxygalactose transaminase
LGSWSEARARHARQYGEVLAGLPGVLLPKAGPDEDHVWNQFTIRCRDAARIRASLDAANIEWRHYYPLPCYRQPALGSLQAPEGLCPEAERACREAISLPIYPALAKSAIERIADVVRRAARL